MPDPLLGFCPPELCSTRVAVRRLRRRCPLDVQTVQLTARQLALTVYVPKHTARPTRSDIMGNNLSSPRLQGFAPHGSPPPKAGCLGRPKARSSPGFSPLQGVLPRWNGLAFTTPPLMGFVLQDDESSHEPAPTGCCFQTRLADLRRDCRPSWGLSPYDHHNRLGR
jgi:hypothetical protein